MTWIAISWFQQLSNTVVRGYIVIVEGPEAGNISVEGSVRNVNITGLEFGVYTLRVIAVGFDGQLSPPSPPLTANTAIPGEK